MNRHGVERGFSLLGILLAAVIVSVLTVMALKEYAPLIQSTSGGGPRNALGMDMTNVRIRQLHQAELAYYGIHGHYATWAELVQDGGIPRGYTDTAGRNSTPFVPCHDIEIEITQTGFVITATPNIASGAPEGSPILRIDQSGRLEEVRAE